MGLSPLREAWWNYTVFWSMILKINKQWGVSVYLNIAVGAQIIVEQAVEGHV